MNERNTDVRVSAIRPVMISELLTSSSISAHGGQIHRLTDTGARPGARQRCDRESISFSTQLRRPYWERWRKWGWDVVGPGRVTDVKDDRALGPQRNGVWTKTQQNAFKYLIWLICKNKQAKLCKDIWELEEKAKVDSNTHYKTKPVWNIRTKMT